MGLRSRRRSFAIVLVACALGGAGVAQGVPFERQTHLASSPETSAASAAAPPFPFGCRASGARVSLSTATLAEPIVANKATTPCQTDSAAAGTISVPTSNPLLTAGPIGAFTLAAGTPTVAPGAAAVADVQAVNIPTSSGTITILGPVQADAAYQCSDGKLTSDAQSTLDLIYVNGKAVPLPAPGAPATIHLGLVVIRLNQQIATADSITERVLEVTVPEATTGFADIVVGEATVTRASADPCLVTTGTPPAGGGATTTAQACPPGSTLDVPAKACVIIYNGQTIFVSEPFKGPTGGVVLALGAARGKYRGPCLSGPGPNWVLVATKRGGRVQGTPHSDRILALGAGERVAGLAGNDCIDGSGGHGQKLYDGNGRDRVFGGPGANRLGVGNGNDYVNGRNGSGDWITAGNGDDIVYGARGNTRIDVGLGRDRVYGGPGTNRIWAIGDRARVSCGTGRHNRAYLRPNAAPFAGAHGCQTIHLLRR